MNQADDVRIVIMTIQCAVVVVIEVIVVVSRHCRGCHIRSHKQDEILKKEVLIQEPLEGGVNLLRFWKVKWTLQKNFLGKDHFKSGFAYALLPFNNC